MNAKIYSLLVMLFLGLSLGFSSCSDDDDDDDSSSSSSYESGKTAGSKFQAAYNAYKSSEDITTKMTQGAILVTSYNEYKAKKDDADWKKGFLVGAAAEEASKYETLETLLNTDLDLSSTTGIANAITELQKILG